MVLLYSSDVPALQSRFLGDVSGLAEYVDNTVRIILMDTYIEYTVRIINGHTDSMYMDNTVRIILMDTYIEYMVRIINGHTDSTWTTW